jgi:hypothetical protein
LFLIVFSRLKDEMLEELENLPDPNVLATDIVEDLACALTRVGPTQPIENKTEPAKISPVFGA